MIEERWKAGNNLSAFRKRQCETVGRPPWWLCWEATITNKPHDISDASVLKFKRIAPTFLSLHHGESYTSFLSCVSPCPVSCTILTRKQGEPATPCAIPQYALNLMDADLRPNGTISPRLTPPTDNSSPSEAGPQPNDQSTGIIYRPKSI